MYLYNALQGTTVIGASAFTYLAGGDSSGPDIATLTQYGILGAVVIMIISGLLMPKWAKDSIEKERDNWKEAYDKERDAHDKSREALFKAEQRAEVALDISQSFNALLMELRHKPDTRTPGVSP